MCILQVINYFSFSDVVRRRSFSSHESCSVHTHWVPLMLAQTSQRLCIYRRLLKCSHSKIKHKFIRTDGQIYFSRLSVGKLTHFRRSISQRQGFEDLRRCHKTVTNAYYATPLLPRPRSPWSVAITQLQSVPYPMSRKYYAISFLFCLCRDNSWLRLSGALLYHVIASSCVISYEPIFLYSICQQ